ncbi:MAG: protein-glutamate O-methyltransferase CheR [Myxococcales bacterium]|nr:protein-glutamate O-methyltransferase CheR [Myxococcales bacterium]
MDLTVPEYEAIRTCVRKQLGIELGPERRAMVRRRLGNLPNGRHLVDSVVSEGLGSDELSVLADALTTNHTHWGREAEHFELLRNWLRDHPVPRPFRIWCAASSTGEEPYSLWMVAREQSSNALVLATDISERVLAVAREGVYDGDGLHHLPTGWRKHFTHLPDGKVQLSDAARGGVLFRRLNLMTKPFPLRRSLDVIFCRNVMIYFEQDVRLDLVRRLVDKLAPGGLLCIGLAETLPKGVQGLERVAPSAFRKSM